MIAEETGQPFSEIENDGERDYTFYAEKATAHGLVEEIVKSYKK